MTTTRAARLRLLGLGVAAPLGGHRVPGVEQRPGHGVAYHGQHVHLLGRHGAPHGVGVERAGHQHDLAAGEEPREGGPLGGGVHHRGQRQVADLALGDALGQMYVAKYFTPGQKKEALTMVHGIESAMGKDIEQSNWMSPATKKEAQAKLASFTPKIGYPSRWRDYSKVEIKPEAIDPDDREGLEDLLITAINKALDAAQEMAGKEMEAATSGMMPNIPGLNLPF